jgi:hypothetical protein
MILQANQSIIQTPYKRHIIQLITLNLIRNGRIDKLPQSDSLRDGAGKNEVFVSDLPRTFRRVYSAQIFNTETLSGHLFE